MNRKVLLASSGPYQFLNELSYAIQTELFDDIIGVIRYNYSSLSLPSDLFKCERWLYDCLHVKFFEPPINLWQVWGKDSFEKIMHFPVLRNRVRKTLTSLLNGIYLDEITDLILPYRPNFQDVLLINSFKNVKIHFVDEGSSMDFKSYYRLPFPFKFLAYKNPYDKNENKEIYVNNGLDTSFERFGKINKLNGEIRSKYIYSKIINNHQFANWFKLNFGKYNTIPLSILMLQPFDRTMTLEKEVNFYKRIILNEIDLSNNMILIKFHPRDNYSKREFIKKD